MLANEPFFMDGASEVTYNCAINTKTLDNVQPKVVMAPEELARWNQLPADEQLARLRAAIQRGIDSGLAHVTMDEIWVKIRARHPDASSYHARRGTNR